MAAVSSLALVIAAAGWSAFWFYAAERANQIIAGWLEREARVGRIYRCGSQSLGGFPFRIEVRCTNASVEVGDDAIRRFRFEWAMSWSPRRSISRRS